MDETLILSLAAGVMTTVAFIMMYRDGKEQKEIMEAEQAQDEAIAKTKIKVKTGKKK